MGIIFSLLTLPFLGAPRTVHWLAQTIYDAALREFLDEGRVRGALLESQELYDGGAITEEEYDRRERELLDRLAYIREIKAQSRQQG